MKWYFLFSKLKLEKRLITLETVQLDLARRTLINVLSLSFIKYLFKAGYLNLKQDTDIPKALEKAVLWTNISSTFLLLDTSENLFQLG